MAKNLISMRRNGPMSSSEEYEPVTPDDATDLSQVTVAVHVGSPGDLCVVRPDGVEVTLPRMSAGTHPLCVARVKATGTTATDISAFY